MNVFEPFLKQIDDLTYRNRLEEMLNHIQQQQPELEPVIKWNQPIFQHHGTFIIGFSISKQHIAVASEPAGLEKFKDQLAARGYSATKQLFRIRWNQEVDYELMDAIVEFNMTDKAQCTSFWRK